MILFRWRIEFGRICRIEEIPQLCIHHLFHDCLPFADSQT
jgi:hypothetical protein